MAAGSRMVPSRCLVDCCCWWWRWWWWWWFMILVVLVEQLANDESSPLLVTLLLVSKLPRLPRESWRSMTTLLVFVLLARWERLTRKQSSIGSWGLMLAGDVGWFVCLFVFVFVFLFVVTWWSNVFPPWSSKRVSLAICACELWLGFRFHNSTIFIFLVDLPAPTDAKDVIMVQEFNRNIFHFDTRNINSKLE